MSQSVDQAMNLVELVVEQITQSSELNPKYVRDTLLTAVPSSCSSELFGLEELRTLALEYLQQLYLEEFSQDQTLN